MVLTIIDWCDHHQYRLRNLQATLSTVVRWHPKSYHPMRMHPDISVYITTQFYRLFHFPHNNDPTVGPLSICWSDMNQGNPILHDSWNSEREREMKYWNRERNYKLWLMNGENNAQCDNTINTSEAMSSMPRIWRCFSASMRAASSGSAMDKGRLSASMPAFMFEKVRPTKKEKKMKFFYTVSTVDTCSSFDSWGSAAATEVTNVCFGWKSGVGINISSIWGSGVTIVTTGRLGIFDATVKPRELANCGNAMLNKSS